MRRFCLTLPETPERTEKARKHFQEMRVYDVTFFNGIHAERAGLQTHHLYEVDNPGTGFKIGHKPTGIWLSHIMLWAALNLLWDEHFMILEVDAQFGPDWHTRVNSALTDAPRDFDMLYVGSCCCKGRPTKHIKGDVYEVRWPLCSHAYIVAKKALPILLASQRKCWSPIDIGLGFDTFDKNPEMKVYTVLPRIVEQFDTVIPP